MTKKLIEWLIQTNSHIGTLVKSTHPKTRFFQLWSVNWVTLINPETTASQLDTAKERIQLSLSQWKEILIICEKSMFAEKIESLSKQFGIHYFIYSTPSGVLTNFNTLVQRIKSMNELKKFSVSEEFKKLTKKEQSMKKRELKKIEKIYAWVTNLKKVPDLVIIIDGQALDKFVKEITKLWKENIVLSTTNFNQYWNDDSLVVTNVNNYDSLEFAVNHIFGIK